MKDVSIIIPTLNEAETIDTLIIAIQEVMRKASIGSEIIVVDDGSTDGTQEKIRELPFENRVTLFCRKNKKGLASAVMEGAAIAKNDVVVVMDGDLSHAPEDIPRIVHPLLEGICDIAIGSRYTQDGSTPGWPIKRKVASRIASFPAQIMTGVDDPLSGFFAVQREKLLGIQQEVPGYKICLELIVRQYENPEVTEIPISFKDRQFGSSKMTKGVLKDYMVQLSGLCKIAIPKSCWMILVSLMCLGFVTDVGVYAVMISAGYTLLISQIAGLIGSIVIIEFAYQNLNQVKIIEQKDLWHPRLLLYVFFLLVLRSGYIVFLQNQSWELSVLNFVPMAALTALVISMSLIFVLNGPKESLKRAVQFRLWIFATILVSLALRLLYAGSFELLKEEAYYWNYAQHLDIGYFDHPPMVALLIKLGTVLFGNNEFAVRIGAVFCWCIATLFVYLYTRDISNRDTGLQAIAIMAVIPAFFGFGFLMTPDAPVIACWAGTLYFARRAMVDMNKKSWLGVGIFLGLGLFSKYTIALLGLSFLVFMIIDQSSRRWFRKPHPYAAAVMALLIFSPVIVWNFQHEWASFLFQTQERLESSSEFSSHELIASIFVMLSPVGFFAALFFLVSRRKFINDDKHKTRREYTFAFVTVIVPLTVFILFSLTKEIKLNWTSPLWLAAMPFFARTLSQTIGSKTGPERKKVTFHRAWKVTIVVCLVAYGGVFHYLSVGIPGVPYPDEGPLFGWKNFAVQIDDLVESIEQETGIRPIVIGMDQYKTASGLAFYRNYNFERQGKGDKGLRSPVFETAGRNAFGHGAVMYDYWFSPKQLAGKPLLVVSLDAAMLDKSKFAGKVGQMGPLKEIKTRKNNQQIRPLFYRFMNVINIDNGLTRLNIERY